MHTKSKTIRFKTSYYFPKTVRAIGAVFGVFGLAMVWTSPALGLVFLFIAGVIFTTHYGFEINESPNSIREYISVLGYKDGKPSPYKSIEFIFIQPGVFRYLTYALRMREAPAHEAYLKFEGRNEVQMHVAMNKDWLINRMRDLSAQLNVPLLDYSEGNPITLHDPNPLQKNLEEGAIQTGYRNE